MLRALERLKAQIAPTRILKKFFGFCTCYSAAAPLQNHHYR